jgi:polyisoprenoid-binding protein YceI
VEVSIRTASIDMDDGEWEQHLRSKDFFRVDEFPQMQFRSTGVTPVGDRQARVDGELTLLGVTRPVTLEVTFNKAGIHPKSKQYIAGFSARGVVQRSEFGMTYAVPMVGDVVEVVLEVEGIRQEE